MSYLPVAGVLHMVTRLFLRVRHWGAVNMAGRMCKNTVSGSKGVDCGSCGGWRMLVVWVLSGVLGSVWFSCSLEEIVLPRILVWGDQVGGNASSLSTWKPLLRAFDQEHKNIFQIFEPLHCEIDCRQRLILLLLKIIGWAFVGLLAVCVAPGLHPKPGKHEQKQIVQPREKHPIKLNCKVAGRRRKKLLVLGVAAGLLVSFWIFWDMSTDNISRRKETLANMCDERARMLQDQFNVSMNHVHALAILISTFHHRKLPSAIDQVTFAEYTARTAFERPLTSGVAYALKILHSQREQFEKQQGWRIKKMEKEDQSPVQDDYMPENLDPSPVQEEYAPVVLSQETVSHIVSVDMMSGKEDRENILRARASGKGVLTSPFKLLKSYHLGVVLTFAVYRNDLPPNATPEERIAATEGYLGASFDVETLVEKLLQQLASKQTIVVNVYDTTNASEPIKMYGPDATDNGLLHISHLDFSDPYRKHEMHCSFKQKPSLPWSAISTSVGVAVIVLLLGHIFHAAISRIEKVEYDYREMRELKVRAEAADVAKSQFLATVSHEIRTPMNGVLGMLHMLMDTDLDATQQDFAMTAHASGKALIALINEVLDQAKIESGRLELESVPFDVREILDNVLSLFSDKSHDKGIELAIYVSDKVPEIIVGDPGRFRQIITNLVGNSIKFTEEGHVFVSVHLTDEVISSENDQVKRQIDVVDDKSDVPGNTLSGYQVAERWKSWLGFKKLNTSKEATESINLLVTVEDSGVGICRDAQSRIFMPFMQADSSTSRTYGGTGIGLSISKCLVDLMGGEIGFVSERGVGSTFAFTAIFREGQRSLADVKRHQSNTMVSDFKGMRGLVVDVKRIRAEVTSYHLQRLGIHVEIAICLKSLFSCPCDNLISRFTGHFDMVLIDKEVLGKDTCNQFSSLLIDLPGNPRKISFADPPRIFILATSLSLAEIEDLRSTAHMVNVIMKPLRLSMLAACLRKALGVGNKRQQDKGKPSFLRTLLNGKHILVVDDNMVNRRVAAGALKKYGASVTCADSGKSAVAILQPPHNFHACFMDVQMPEMDGFEATRLVRAKEKQANDAMNSTESALQDRTHWHVPILAMTADVFQATHDECIKCGMDGYVTKPFEEEQLYSALALFFESGTVE